MPIRAHVSKVINVAEYKEKIPYDKETDNDNGNADDLPFAEHTPDMLSVFIKECVVQKGCPHTDKHDDGTDGNRV